MVPSENGILRINGAELYFEASGGGYPLFMLHGHLLDSGQWEDQFATFAGKYRVMRYDARGYGRSSLPPAPFAHHEDLYELMRALNITRAHLMGCSGGGATIMDFALVHPEMVSALVLVGAGISGYQPSGEIPQWWTDLSEARTSGNVERAVEISLRTFTDGRRTPEQVNPAVRERTRAMTARLFARPLVREAAQRMPEPPAVSRLSEFRIPTLAIVGGDDLPMLHEAADLITTNISGSRKVTIPDAGHHPNMEHPGIFNREVFSFLRDQLVA